MATINSNMTRITGMASGLDVDSLVKTALKPYQAKVDQKTQQKDVVEIKQKLYRDLLNDSKNFYNKYFDILSKDNLISSTNYKAVKFTPSSDAVSIVAGSESQQDNYKVTVTEMATAASAMIDGTKVVAGTKAIKINGQDFDFVGTNGTEIAKNLTSQLQKAGIRVSARYTDFAGTAAGTNAAGMILESTVLGKDSTFSVGTNFMELTSIVSSDPLITNVGADATASTITGINHSDVIAANSISVDYDGDGTMDVNVADLGLTNINVADDVVAAINSKIDTSKVKATKAADGSITFSSATQGAASSAFKVAIGGGTATTATAGTDATASVSTFNKSDILGGKITINGNQVDLTSVTTETDLNALIQDKGLTAKINTADNTITFTSVAKGSSSAFTIAKADGAAAGLQASSTKPGVDANVTIENLTKGGTYTVTGNKNTVTLDGSTFTFNNTTGATPVTITAKKDATELKDKIVKFIADYNTMIEKLNTTVMTKHTRGYDPLTSDQKKEMSDDEVKLWNQKVEAGQLYRDDDISRISNSMKESMRTLMSSTGLDLERIGIVPVKDYAGTKNGTFSIPDESKLQKAIEENPEDVMDLFTRKAPTKEELAALPDEAARIKRKDQTGIFVKLKNTLYSETMSSDSSLAKKVGLEGTGTFTSNTLTKSISDYEKKIKDMQKSLASREQALYTKYANLEKILNQYNAQQSSLTASLGTN